ncbi:MAG: hypothetical protein IJF07_03825 [Lachnospiraceae bacterium]|nr:hypothetical protein [Lachnospiraceae bacterium]
MKGRYKLDSSAIIHLASRNDSYTNSFRIAITLQEKICPKTLQEALDHVTPRFPTIMAGIRKRAFTYDIVPVAQPPRVEEDRECLFPMSKERLETCATWVGYGEKHICVEIFHSITDGSGGKVFISSLVAEYLSIRYGIQISYSDKVLNPEEAVQEGELRDDYITYAGKKAIPANHAAVYQIPGDNHHNQEGYVISREFETKALLEAAHQYGTSLTTYLTAVMVDTILQIQRQHSAEEPIQIMVPVNLRNKFESNTLYNFSLYALPRIEPTVGEVSLEELIRNLSEQLKVQLSVENLQGMMAMNLKSQNIGIFKILPLPIKMALLRMIYRFYGERNSCISVSNFGEMVFPKEMKDYIKGVECMLTPRRNAPYNCSLISYNGIVRINITRRGNGCGLEEVFFHKLVKF